MKMKVVDNAMTWTTQREKFLPQNFFPPEINFLYLPKNNQFFKRKNFPHPPERTNFPLKEKIYYTYLKNSNFSIEKSSSTYLKEINFLPKEKFI